MEGVGGEAVAMAAEVAVAVVGVVVVVERKEVALAGRRKEVGVQVVVVVVAAADPVAVVETASPPGAEGAETVRLSSGISSVGEVSEPAVFSPPFFGLPSHPLYRNFSSPFILSCPLPAWTSFRQSPSRLLTAECKYKQRAAGAP